MRIRTADPLHAMQMLYQLSYAPMRDRSTFRRGDAYSLFLCSTAFGDRRAPRTLPNVILILHEYA